MAYMKTIVRVCARCAKDPVGNTQVALVGRPPLQRALCRHGVRHKPYFAPLVAAKD